MGRRVVVEWVTTRLPSVGGTVAVVTNTDASPRWMYFSVETRRFHPLRGIWRNRGLPMMESGRGDGLTVPCVVAWCGLPEYSR